MHQSPKKFHPEAFQSSGTWMIADPELSPHTSSCVLAQPIHPCKLR